MPQAVVSDSLLYVDDTCKAFQHKKYNWNWKANTKRFSCLCDWFVDNKLSLHFDQGKIKSILFGTKHELRNAKP